MGAAEQHQELCPALPSAARVCAGTALPFVMLVCNYYKHFTSAYHFFASTLLRKPGTGQVNQKASHMPPIEIKSAKQYLVCEEQIAACVLHLLFL